MTGYSGKPLVEKLGIKPGARVSVVNAPPVIARSSSRYRREWS